MGDMSNLLHNATVDTLLERRSIRKFKSKPLGDDVIETLETVAQHAASSQFLNDWSAIRVTDPALKPRMPRSMQFFENEYPSNNETLLAGLQDFDEEVHRYYDLRNTERPVDPFSDQIASNAVDSGVTSKAVAPNAKRQGFRLER